MSRNPPQDSQPLLKPTDLASRLGVSRSWLYDAAKAGRIPSIRIGGEEGPLRFVPDDIDSWLDQARAAWSPGRSTVATRTLTTSRPRQRTKRASSARKRPPDGQQRLL
jgi:excisionase family DNA binding protein